MLHAASMDEERMWKGEREGKKEWSGGDDELKCTSFNVPIRAVSCNVVIPWCEMLLLKTEGIFHRVLYRRIWNGKFTFPNFLRKETVREKERKEKDVIFRKKQGDSTLIASRKTQRLLWQPIRIIRYII